MPTNSSNNPAHIITQAWHQYLSVAPNARSAVSMFSLLLLMNGLVNDIKRIVAKHREQSHKDEQTDDQRRESLFPRELGLDFMMPLLEGLFLKNLADDSLRPFPSASEWPLPSESELTAMMKQFGFKTELGNFSGEVVSNAYSVIAMLERARQSTKDETLAIEEKQAAVVWGNLQKEYAEGVDSEFYELARRVHANDIEKFFHEKMFPRLQAEQSEWVRQQQDQPSQNQQLQDQQRQTSIAICSEYGHAIIYDLQLSKKRGAILSDLIRQLKKHGISMSKDLKQKLLEITPQERSLNDLIGQKVLQKCKIQPATMEKLERLHQIQWKLGDLYEQINAYGLDGVTEQIASINQLLAQQLSSDPRQGRSKAQVFWQSLKWALNKILEWMTHLFGKEKNNSSSQKNLQNAYLVGRQMGYFMDGAQCPQSREMTRLPSATSLSEQSNDPPTSSVQVSLSRMHSLRSLSQFTLLGGKHRRSPVKMEWDEIQAALAEIEQEHEASPQTSTTTFSFS